MGRMTDTAHTGRPPTTRGAWRDDLADAAAAQDGLVSAAQLRELGVPSSTASGRVRDGGMWSRVLPGVHLVTGGRPDRRQRERAALLYAAPHGILAGPTVLRHLGVRAGRLQEVSDDHRSPERVHLLVPHEHHLLAAGYLEITRTRRWPDEQLVDGLRMTSACRAIADSARSARSAREVAVLVDECIRRGLTSLDDLLVELREGPRQGSAHLRRALLNRAEAASAGLEALLEALVAGAGLAQQREQVRLVGPSGEPVGQPAVWIDSVGLAIEVATPDPAWVARQQRYSMFGVPVFPVSSQLLQADPAGQARVLSTAVATAARRPRPAVSAVRVA